MNEKNVLECLLKSYFDILYLALGILKKFTFSFETIYNYIFLFAKKFNLDFGYWEKSSLLLIPLEIGAFTLGHLKVSLPKCLQINNCKAIVLIIKLPHIVESQNTIVDFFLMDLLNIVCIRKNFSLKRVASFDLLVCQ